MPPINPQLSETHVVGTATREWKVRAQECPVLAGHHIAHVGVADAAAPYEMVRMDLSGTFLLSCFAGRGEILVHGQNGFPALECGSELVALEQAIALGVEHRHVGGPRDEHVDGCDASWPHGFADLRENGARIDARKEHEQADAHHAVIASGSGGMITAPLLSMLVVPVAYFLLLKFRRRKELQ